MAIDGAEAKAQPVLESRAAATRCARMAKGIAIQGVLCAALVVSCKDKPAATTSPASVAPSAKLQEPAVATKACASIAAALAKLPAPSFVQGAKVAWPPPANAECRYSEIDDLNNDGRKDVQVECDPGTGEEAMGERAFRLYAATADGCLVDVGQLAGVEWHPAEASATVPAAVGGFVSLEARGRGVDEDVGTSVEVVAYKYDPATKQYIEAERRNDLIGDPADDVETPAPDAKRKLGKREIAEQGVGKVRIGMAGKKVLAMKGAKKREATCPCDYDVELGKLRINIGEDHKVCAITVRDPAYKLASGIGVGSTLQQVTKALGAPEEVPATGDWLAGDFTFGFDKEPPRADSKVTGIGVGGCGE